MLNQVVPVPISHEQPEILTGHLGASVDKDNRCSFLVWAPNVDLVQLHLVYPEDRLVPMHPLGAGYWGVVIRDCPPGVRYFYRLNHAVDRPDPASRSQPEGVHGASEVLPHVRKHASEWRGVPLDEFVIYELHVGTFTSDGTLDAIIPHLHRLKQMGITAIELMPVAEFAGGRNWGYDGVYPFAVHRTYGGVEGLRRLVQACHDLGLSVVLDVVYNHLGPEGNYLREFGPYFITCDRTPWGDAMNFDGPESDEVRRFFIENALYWITECGIDALRLDAVHAIHDRSAYPFLQELADRVHDYASAAGRNVYLIAESDLNDSRLLRSADEGGFGLDAQWSGDFHHCLHTLLTGESSGYYADFGTLRQFATAMQEGWVYSGQYSRVRRVRFGNSPVRLGAHQFVVFSQNHDETGNRMQGDRLIHLVGYAGARLAAAAVLLSPYIPLLFMGEEYGEPAPFLYHISHTDAALQEAVRRGRKEEFAAFLDRGEPPDPQAEATFFASKLCHELVTEGMHALLYAWYTALLHLRRSHPALCSLSKASTVVECNEESKTVVIRRLSATEHAIIVLHFGEAVERLPVYLPHGEWSVVLDSEDQSYGGNGGGFAAVSPVQSNGECVNFNVARFGCLVLSGKPD